MKKYLQKTFALTELGASELLKASTITVFINIVIMAVSGISYYFIQDTLLPILEDTAPVYTVLIYVGYAIFILFLLAVLYYFQYNFCYISAYEESANMRISLAETLRKLPLSFFGKKDLSDLTSTIMSDVSMMENAFSHFIPGFIGSIISTTIMGIGMFMFDWRLALSLTWVIPISFILCIASKKLQDYFLLKTKAIQLTYLDKIQECLENVKDIKANNRENAHLKIMDAHFEKHENMSMKAEFVTGIFVSTAQMILKLGIATTMIVGVTLLATGEVSLLTFLVFLMIASRIYDPLAGALINLAGIFISLKSVERMKEFENTKIQSGNHEMSPNGYDINFENVKFSYGSQEETFGSQKDTFGSQKETLDTSETVLNGVSFTAKQGEVTALVGPSGGGKSTAMKLAARFWDVNGGKISIGQQDVSEVDPETLLKEISIVFQDVTLFNNTVMENIRIGRKGATDDEVMEAAKNAQCHEFIMSMPDGYNTLIGENGSKLSGGERQRLSIARALLKDAPIVLLDEATSSLDIQNESKVQKAISKLTQNKTVIVIAHRMRTIAGANKIVLLKEGKVSAEGSHSEMLKKSSDYANMIKLQTESANWVLS